MYTSLPIQLIEITGHATCVKVKVTCILDGRILRCLLVQHSFLLELES
jgi:hypothetical protein